MLQISLNRRGGLAVFLLACVCFAACIVPEGAPLTADGDTATDATETEKISPWTSLSPEGDAGTDYPEPRRYPALGYGGNYRALLFGGYDGTTYFADTWVWYQRDKVWRERTPLTSPSGREGAAISYGGENKVYLFGGSDGTDPLGVDNPASPTEGYIWEFDLENNTWTQITVTGTVSTDYPKPRWGGRLAWLGSKTLALMGGTDGTDYFRKVWLYKTDDQTWSQATMSGTEEPAGLLYPGWAQVKTDSLVLFGGEGSGNNMVAQTWFFDIGETEATWEIRFASGSRPPAVSAAAFARLNDDLLLLFSGETFGESLSGETWLLRGKSGGWERVTNLENRPESRKGAGSCQISAGKALVFGGLDEDDKALADIWEFDSGEVP